LEKSLAKQGMKILAGTKVDKAETTNKGVKLTVSGKTSETIEAAVALVAIGVSPLLPQGVKLETDEKGWLKTNENYETNVKGIYAAGDIIGPPWLAHVASYEAVQAVEGMFGVTKPRRVTVFPGCTYCQPQVASVGLTERAVKEKGIKYKVGKFPFLASGKALAVGESEGFVKLLIGEPHGEILGAHIIGADATEMIAELGLAITLEATYDELVATIHAHPTLSEAVHGGPASRPRDHLISAHAGALCGLLRFAIAQLIGLVHKDRSNLINEFTGKLCIAREVHPTEFLDGRESGGELVGIDFLVSAGERQTVFQAEELVAAGLLVFDGKADEIFRRLSVLPVVMRGHTVATMQF
jgi:hypothetical protein